MTSRTLEKPVERPAVRAALERSREPIKLPPALPHVAVRAEAGRVLPMSPYRTILVCGVETRRKQV